MASGLYLVITARRDALLQAVVKHQLYVADKARYSNLQLATKFLQQYDVWPDLVGSIQRGDAIPEALEGILQLKAAQVSRLVSTLTAKPIHKVYYLQTSMAEGTDTDSTFAWLTDGRFRAETEELVIAAQDGVILTNCYKHDVLKTSATAQCRACREGEESIGHIVSACKSHILALYKESRVPSDDSSCKRAGSEGVQLYEVGCRWLAWCGSTRRGQS